MIGNNVTGDGGMAAGSNVSAGRGGGIYSYGPLSQVNISGSTITGNVSGDSASLGEGGGIYLDPGGILSLDNSTISDNISSLDAGGIDNGATIDHITNCTIAGNTAQEDGGGAQGAGGLYNVGTINLISGTTFSGNMVLNTLGMYAGGGGILNWGSIGTIVNSTISGNSVATGDDGGGILNNSNIGVIESTTIADNSADDGGGLFHSTFANATPVISEITNTIIAGNTAYQANGANDFKELGQVTSATYDLVQSPNGNNLTNGVNGNIVGLDPLLGVLASNGGPTQTLSLLFGSPAIDAGTSTAPRAPTSAACPGPIPAPAGSTSAPSRCRGPPIIPPSPPTRASAPPSTPPSTARSPPPTPTATP